MLDIMTLIILSVVSVISILSVAVGVAHRMKVVSRRRFPPKIVSDFSTPTTLRRTASSKTAAAAASTTSSKPIWTAKEKNGVKFCSDMIFVDMTLGREFSKSEKGKKFGSLALRRLSSLEDKRIQSNIPITTT